MAQGVVERQTLTYKVRDVLRLIPIAGEVGRPPAPAQGGKTPNLPYFIVYPIEGGDFYGPPLGDPESSATLVFQVTSVGDSPKQVEMVADRIRRTLLARADGNYVTRLDTPTVAVTGRWSLGAGSMDSDSRLHSIAERFQFYACLV